MNAKATVFLAVAVGMSPTACSSIYGPECPAESGGYRLEPGDALRVTMFRHFRDEDLSGEFILDAEGNFSLPPVGEIRGGGQTARQLEAEIEAALKSGGYLLDPQVSIEVLNYRPFYVIGEVNVPGSFEYIEGMTVITAVTLAGGFTYRAYQDGVAIERSGKEVEPSRARRSFQRTSSGSQSASSGRPS
jgi:protein involved in polysaccharide export with SLBB domain